MSLLFLETLPLVQNTIVSLPHPLLVLCVGERHTGYGFAVGCILLHPDSECLLGALLLNSSHFLPLLLSPSVGNSKNVLGIFNYTLEAGVLRKSRWEIYFLPLEKACEVG
jgi:hypothetical protein